MKSGFPLASDEYLGVVVLGHFAQPPLTKEGDKKLWDSEIFMGQTKPAQKGTSKDNHLSLKIPRKAEKVKIAIRKLPSKLY